MSQPCLHVGLPGAALKNPDVRAPLIAFALVECGLGTGLFKSFPGDSDGTPGLNSGLSKYSSSFLPPSLHSFLLCADFTEVQAQLAGEVDKRTIPI